jgi:hypothetical protein
MNQPSNAVRKKRPPQTINAVPIQEYVEPDRSLKTEEGEYRNTAPTTVDPRKGRDNQAGTLLSLDFWTIGREIILSSTFTIRNNYTSSQRKGVAANVNIRI